MDREHYTRIKTYHEFTIKSADVVQAAEDHGKSIMDRIMPMLLKVSSPSATCSAFLVNKEPLLYASTAHGIPAGTTTLQAVDMAGTAHNVLVKHVQPALDLAVLEVAPHDNLQNIQTVSFAQTSTGSTVYLFGFGGNDLDVHFTSGSITSVRPGIYSTSAYADNGFSGGPVVNIAGQIVGVVQRGDEGVTNKQTLLISADRLLTFLQMSGVPTSS